MQSNQLWVKASDLMTAQQDWFSSFFGIIKKKLLKLLDVFIEGGLLSLYFYFFHKFSNCLWISAHHSGLSVLTNFVNSVNLSHQPFETKDDIEMKAKKLLSKKNSRSWLKYSKSAPGEMVFIKGISVWNGCIHKQQSTPTLHLTLFLNTF